MINDIYLRLFKDYKFIIIHTCESNNANILFQTYFFPEKLCILNKSQFIKKQNKGEKDH